ncbi:MAG TPA: beta-galactosidase, partial [Terriglobia bacterium]|nr:beta-galactosidase [Terriglobia bacterium]
MKPSRRNFLRTALAAPLAAQLGGPVLGGLALGTPLGALPLGENQFQNPEIIRYDADCFTINGRDTFIHSGAFHYCRCPRELWRDRLMKFKQAGFNTIETYVFWNYHEPIQGKTDLSEFEDFVKLIQEMGFWTIVRPGPYVCAEWDAGGFPHWVIVQQFPLRSAAPQSIATSKHWYDAVLPVIQRHQITNGGRIIMIQVENEYDYWKLGEAEKRQYITALANMVWSAGIDIPVITNWCKQARENSDPVMSRIVDTADFYPRWNIVKEVVPRLEKLRKQEPGSPVGITELQGGWFSQFGGKLTIDQPGVGPAQLNMLTKTAIERGVTYYSYYMGFGGTNFDWAGKKLTTTYDYAAPIREPGGLWKKYYEARGICAALRHFGGVLTRAKALPGAQSTNPAISVTARVNGKSGVLFVRENANQNQQFKLSFPDPASPTHRLITVPREGQLTLGARGMKMVPVQIAIPGGHLRYTTAEVLGHGASLDRAFVLIYDEPGSLVEIALATENEPKVEGDAAYQYWDSEYESVVIGLKIGKAERMLLVNQQVQVIAVPRDRALRTWIAEYPSSVIPDAESKSSIQVPFITDSVLMSDSGADHHHAWADLHFAPGEHELAVLVPTEPNKCTIDGASAQVNYDERWRTAHVRLSTPALPARPVTPNDVERWVEQFDLHSGDWTTGPCQPLEKIGEIPYGYVKYSAQFSASE